MYKRLIAFWRNLRPYHMYAGICLAVALTLAGFGYFGSTWLTAAIIIVALGSQRQAEVKAIMLATEALLTREQQWREERETLLGLARHLATPHNGNRKCTACGFDRMHPIHIPYETSPEPELSRTDESTPTNSTLTNAEE